MRMNKFFAFYKKRASPILWYSSYQAHLEGTAWFMGMKMRMYIKKVCRKRRHTFIRLFTQLYWHTAAENFKGKNIFWHISGQKRPPVPIQWAC